MSSCVADVPARLPTFPYLQTPRAMKITVVGGGTATNSFASLLSTLDDANVSYVLPISDNGGSTAEILRVFGGPAIGDVRSRITQLVPEKARHLRKLISYRLPDDEHAAKHQWQELVEGTHALWSAVKPKTRELVRSFLVHANTEILKRNRPGKEFRFGHASVGNLFLTGARLFIGSLDSAIELLLRICHIPGNSDVLPAINTNFSYHIEALLADGTVITGQSQISHPTEQSAEPNDDLAREMEQLGVGGQMPAADANLKVPPPFRRARSFTLTEAEDASLPFMHPQLLNSQISFSKMEPSPLIAPIERVYYINVFGQEIKPQLSSNGILSLEESEAVIYSIGSLFTSIIPIISLRGFMEAAEHCKYKILLINGSHDRETYGLSGNDYVRKIVEAARFSMQDDDSDDWNKFVTHVIYMENGQFEVNCESLQSHGIETVKLRGNAFCYDKGDLVSAISKIIGG